MSIKMEFDSVEEMEKFKGYEFKNDRNDRTSNTAYDRTSNTAYDIQLIGHFLQNIAPEYRHLLYRVGTFIILNRENFLIPSNWENMHKKAREEFKLREKC